MRAAPGGKTSAAPAKQFPTPRSTQAPAKPARIIRRLDSGWLIYRENHAADLGPPAPSLSRAQIARLHCPTSGPGWKSARLPDDYIVGGKFSRANSRSHGYLPLYPAWYRRRLRLPRGLRGRLVWLNFGGAYRDAAVFVNGHFVGQHPSGYTAFRYNITRYLIPGRSNRIAVYVDPRWKEGWWYEGGGIYRHVRLMVTRKLHVAPWGTYVISRMSSPISYNPARGESADARLEIETTIANAHRAGRRFRLISRILDPAGQVAAQVISHERLGPGRQRTFYQFVTVRHAELWSLAHRHLYHLATLLRAGHATLDRKQTSFGIRQLRFEPQRGFFLNGKRVELRGVANHQDFPGVGIAVPDNLWGWRIAKLKAMGANAYRCSHNPLPSAFYRACDRMGMLVMDETRHLGDTYAPKTPPGTGYLHLRELRAMVLQHRNFPCIIFWSLANEEGLQGRREGARILRAMQQAAARLDPTRPVTTAMNGGYNRRGFLAVEPIAGINYHCRRFPLLHRRVPGKMLFGSEDFNAYSARGSLRTRRASGRCSEYGCQLLQLHGWRSGHTPWRCWAPVARHRFMAGEFFWTGFDYRGEPNPFGWPAVTSQTGAMDLAGFPKPDYYYWRAWWRTRPSVYCFPAWDLPRSTVGRPVRVRCYANTDRVTLYLNGRNLGMKAMPKYKYLDWQVRYKPGKLSARGWDHGRLVARFASHTPGPAMALRLQDEYPHLVADGESVAPIAVSILDAHGRVVRQADNRVRFIVSGAGRLAGVANGDPASHEPNQANGRRAYHGRCMALIRARSRAGTIRLLATAPGLRPARLVIRTHASPRG